MQIPLHLYECTDCIAVFAVEAHEDLDHSSVVCPMCQQDSTVGGVADYVLVEFEREYPLENEGEDQ